MGFGFGFALQSNQIWAGTCWKLEIDLGTRHPEDTSLILGGRELALSPWRVSKGSCPFQSMTGMCLVVMSVCGGMALGQNL